MKTILLVILLLFNCREVGIALQHDSGLPIKDCTHVRSWNGEEEFEITKVTEDHVCITQKSFPSGQFENCILYGFFMDWVRFSKAKFIYKEKN